MLFFFPLLQFSYKNDKSFAELLCNEGKGKQSLETKRAAEEFLKLYSDELYYISNKFNKRGIPEDSWEYRTKTGYSINVTDDVSDTYVWLFRQAFLKSCSYRGDNAATYKTYITTVLNSDYTFKDWLRHKTKVTGYIPTCIKRLDKTCQEIYKLLRQGKDDDAIIKMMNIEYDEYIESYIMVEDALIKSNQIGLIKKPKFIPIDQPVNKDGDDNRKLELPGEDRSDLKPDTDLVEQIANTILGGISDAERRLLILYWRENHKVEEIFETMSFGIFTKYLSELNIKKSKDIYKLGGLIFSRISKISGVRIYLPIIAILLGASFA